MLDLTHFITSCLILYYSIEVTTLTLLPIGADVNASIYKVEASNQKTYFVKLKRGHFHDPSILILDLLQKTGIQEIIAPIQTRDGTQTQQLDDFTLILYPFIEGQDGFSCLLTDQQWITLGKTLRQVHEVHVPASLKSKLRKEDFSSKWRAIVRSLYANIETISTSDEISLNLLKFLKKNKSTILKLVDRAEKLCQKASSRSLKFVLCHSDIHAGNILLGKNESLYIVDWDAPILAPKERDLMFIGGGIGNVWNNPNEEKLFYEGYGQDEIDSLLLAYYRYERIVEDITEYYKELLLYPKEDQNRPVMYKHFMDMFAPNGVVEIAFATDKHVIE